MIIMMNMNIINKWLIWIWIMILIIDIIMIIFSSLKSEIFEFDILWLNDEDYKINNNI